MELKVERNSGSKEYEGYVLSEEGRDQRPMESLSVQILPRAPNHDEIASKFSWK